MDHLLLIGAGMLVLSVVYLGDIARRRGHAFEYASVLFFGELGLVFIVNAMLPDSFGKTLAMVGLGAGMCVSAVQYRKLFKRFLASKPPSDSSQS